MGDLGTFLIVFFIIAYLLRKKPNQNKVAPYAQKTNEVAIGAKQKVVKKKKKFPTKKLINLFFKLEEQKPRRWPN